MGREAENEGWRLVYESCRAELARVKRQLSIAEAYIPSRDFEDYIGDCKKEEANEEDQAER